MAIFDVSLDEDFIKSLGSLAQVERYAPKMIDEALPILKNKLIQELEQHNHIDTHDLIDSISINKAKASKKGGYYGSVYPKGNDGKGISNAEKLVYIEYGERSQAASGVIAKTTQQTEDEVLAKMQEVFEREALNEK